MNERFSQEEIRLLEHAKNLDLNALAELYDRYAENVFNYMYRRLGDAEAAEDLSAQVFLQMLEALQNDRGWRTTFDAWLYRIAHNLVVDYHRRQSRRARVSLEDAPPILAVDSNPADIADHKLTRERVMLAIQELTPDQAQVVTMRFVEGLSISQVASRMDKTEGAVKALQFRAVASLRRLIIGSHVGYKG
jgi:RNA polymerase sigma-70 factor (ECF subfamily)